MLNVKYKIREIEIIKWNIFTSNYKIIKNVKNLKLVIKKKK